MKKPWLCRLGFHMNIYRDGAMRYSADRCGRCGEWINKEAGALVDRERSGWETASDSEVRSALDSMHFLTRDDD